ncbi:MAG: DNA polymerase, partial [Paracoccaceae bacterium]|nr:DNA polymerase [Paracoccaceae bacterium]
GQPATMLLQVHDELIFEVDENAVDRLIDTARDIMQGACEPVLMLDVPLIVDAGRGANWAEAH